MTVKYDLTEYGPALRVGVSKALNEKGILFNMSEGVLSVTDSDEVVVDEILAAYEALEEFHESVQQEAIDIKAGNLSASCELCGTRPAAPLALKRQVGMVVVMSTYRADLVLCGTCGDAAFKEFQKQTAIKGWTGMRSALMNPVVLGTNAAAIKKHREAIAELRRRNS